MLGATVLAIASLGATAVDAQAPPAAGGYVGKGQLVVQTAFGAGNDKLTVGGDIALEEKGAQLRLDILSLAIPGAGATLSAVLGTQLFPPGGFTVVYDRRASSYTVWSNAKRSYYTSSTAGTAAAGSATGSPAGAIVAPLAAAGDLFGAFAFAKPLKDDTVFNLQLSLAGHGSVNGHPATGLNYVYARTTTSGDAIDIHGTLQLADDLDAVPVQITAGGKTKSIPESSFRLDLTTLARQTPPDADFAVPPGYARAATIGDVLGKTLPL